jgi:hypothetical protein
VFSLCPHIWMELQRSMLIQVALPWYLAAMTDPSDFGIFLAVPERVYKSLQHTADEGVLSVQFHKNLPWLVSGGADGIVKAYHHGI